MKLITVAEYLLARLEELGIRHLFGVPGDFNLGLVEIIEHDQRFSFISECNELNAAYAADGYARVHGISALITTYGPGELSAVNGVAGAYAERVPLLKITGGIALAKQARQLPLHHTLQSGRYDESFKIYQQITCASVILDFADPGAQIDYVIEQCYQRKLPAYLQFPQDLVSHQIPAPLRALQLHPANELEPAKSEALTERLRKLFVDKPRVVFWLGELLQRHNLAASVERLLLANGYPYVVSWGAKGVLSEASPNFAGMYAGDFSLPAVQDFVETADLVVALGVFDCEINRGAFSSKLAQTQLLKFEEQQLSLAGESWLKAGFSQQLAHLLALDAVVGFQRTFVPETLIHYERHYPATAALSQCDEIEHDDLIIQLSSFLRAGDCLVLETGTIGFTAGYYQLPAGCQLISSINWFSIGYALAATTGISLAQSSGRTILLVGDGALQMTAQALSTMLRYGVKPLIIVLNNSGYTIERIFLGEHSRYNDVQEWHYTQLVNAFGGRADCRRISSQHELGAALAGLPRELTQMAFFEIMMDKYKQPQALVKLAARVANLEEKK